MDKEQMIDSVSMALLGHVDSPEDRKLAFKITEAMRIVDRAIFMGKRRFAYYDNAMPIGFGQTISQPSTVARIMLLLKLKPDDKVLEIGSGSGWNASLIAFVAKDGSVLALDIIDELVTLSRKNLEMLCSKDAKLKKRLSNLRILKKNLIDDQEGIDEVFDKIIFSAGIRPGDEKRAGQAAERFLRDGGRLVCPYTNGPLIIIDKKDGKIKWSHTNEQYSFVPLLG